MASAVEIRPETLDSYPEREGNSPCAYRYIIVATIWHAPASNSPQSPLPVRAFDVTENR